MASPYSGSLDVSPLTSVSGSWGCGALTEGKWLSFPWPDPLQELSIAHKELIPLVIAGFVWGKFWAGKVVQFMSHNQAVIMVLTKLFCHDTCLMGYLRCIVFCATRYNFWFTEQHTPGRFNVLADAISRNKVDLFLSQAPPSMERLPEAIPSEISQLLCLQEPNWLCPIWRTLFSTITLKA